MGKAIVTTSLGCEGIPVRDGRDLVIADDPVSFAGAVVGLMRDRERRVELGISARQLAVAQHDWLHIAPLLERVYEG
jgi:glycosyltransferase involved in cell wall biosynthesis